MPEPVYIIVQEPIRISGHQMHQLCTALIHAGRRAGIDEPCTNESCKCAEEALELANRVQRLREQEGFAWAASKGEVYEGR
jgi:hypothetical protein